jgi:hypothetical protein
MCATPPLKKVGKSMGRRSLSWVLIFGLGVGLGIIAQTVASRPDPLLEDAVTGNASGGRTRPSAPPLGAAVGELSGLVTTFQNSPAVLAPGGRFITSYQNRTTGYNRNECTGKSVAIAGNGWGAGWGAAAPYPGLTGSLYEDCVILDPSQPANQAGSGPQPYSIGDDSLIIWHRNDFSINSANGLRNPVHSTSNILDVGPQLNLNRMIPNPAAHSYLGEITFQGNLSFLSGTSAGDPFTTSRGSRSVIVSHPRVEAAGLIPGDWVFYSGARAFNNVVIAGAYRVQAVSTDGFRIDAGSEAVAGGSGGGAVAYSYAHPNAFANYGQIWSEVANPMAGAQQGVIRFATADPAGPSLSGYGVDRMALGQGLFSTSAVGGDKGPDSINFKRYYVDGTALGASGTWVPMLAFGGASTGIAYITQSASYTQSGKYMLAEFRIALASKGTSKGPAVIHGLPVSAADVGAVTVTYYEKMANLSGTFASYASGSSIQLATAGESGTSKLTDASFTNTAVIYGTATYISQ